MKKNTEDAITDFIKKTVDECEKTEGKPFGSSYVCDENEYERYEVKMDAPDRSDIIVETKPNMLIYSMDHTFFNSSVNYMIFILTWYYFAEKLSDIIAVDVTFSKFLCTAVVISIVIAINAKRSKSYVYYVLRDGVCVKDRNKYYYAAWNRIYKEDIDIRKSISAGIYKMKINSICVIRYRGVQNGKNHRIRQHERNFFNCIKDADKIAALIKQQCTSREIYTTKRSGYEFE